MLLLHFVGAFVDIYFSCLTIPVLYLPVCGGLPLGLLSFFGVPVSVQTYAGISIIGVLIATILIFLEDRRYRLVHGHKFSKTRKWHRLLYVTALYFLAATFPAPAFVNLPDQKDAKMIAQNKNWCIPTDNFNHSKFFLLDSTGTFIVICMVSMLSIVISQMFVQIALIFRELLKYTPISRNTQRLQKQYFVAISLQLAIPIVIIAFPVIYIVLSIVLGYYNQGGNNLAFLIFSLHGVLSTLTMLMVHTPYRKSLFEMLHLESFQSASNSQSIWRLSKLYSFETSQLIDFTSAPTSAALSPICTSQTQTVDDACVAGADADSVTI